MRFLVASGRQSSWMSPFWSSHKQGPRELGEIVFELQPLHALSANFGQPSLVFASSPRRCIKTIAPDTWFDKFILFLIIANSITMGMTDYSVVEADSNSPSGGMKDGYKIGSDFTTTTESGVNKFIESVEVRMDKNEDSAASRASTHRTIATITLSLRSATPPLLASFVAQSLPTNTTLFPTRFAHCSFPSSFSSPSR